MNPPLKTDELEEDSVASTPDKELELPADLSRLRADGFLGSAMKWLAQVFADVG